MGAWLSALALVALAAGLVLGWSRLVPASLVLLCATYAAQLVVDDAPLDVKAALFAAGLVVTAELAYWSLEEREGVRGERGDALHRLALVAAVALCSLVVGTLLLAVTDAARAEGLALDVLGAAAAAAVLLVMLVAGRELR